MLARRGTGPGGLVTVTMTPAECEILTRMIITGISTGEDPGLDELLAVETSYLLESLQPGGTASTPSLAELGRSLARMNLEREKTKRQSTKARAKGRQTAAPACKIVPMRARAAGQR